MEPRAKESYQIEIKASNKTGIVYVPHQVLAEFKNLKQQRDKEQFLKALSTLLIQSGDAETYYLGKIKKEKQANGEEGYTIIFLNQNSNGSRYVSRSFTLTELGEISGSALFKSASVGSPEKFSRDVNTKLSTLEAVKQAYESDVEKKAEEKRVIKERAEEKAAEQKKIKEQEEAERKAKEKELADIKSEQEERIASEARQKERAIKAEQEQRAKQAEIEKEQAAKEAKIAAERAELRAKLFQEESAKEKKRTTGLEKKLALQSAANPFSQACAVYQKDLVEIEKKIVEIEEKQSVRMQQLLGETKAYDPKELLQRVKVEEKSFLSRIRQSKEDLSASLAENAKSIVELKQKEKRALDSAQVELSKLRLSSIRAGLQEAVNTYTSKLSPQGATEFLAKAEALGVKNVFIKDPVRGNIIINPDILMESLVSLNRAIEEISKRFGPKHELTQILELELDKPAEVTLPMLEVAKNKHQEAIIAIREKAAKSVASMTAQAMDFSLSTYREAVQLHTDLYETEAKKLLEIQGHRAAVKAAPENISALIKKNINVAEEGAKLLQSMKLPEGELSKSLQASLDEIVAANKKLVELKTEVEQKSVPISVELASRKIDLGTAQKQAEVISDMTRQAKEQDAIIHKAMQAIKNAHLYQTTQEASKIFREMQEQKQQETALREKLEKPQKELYDLVKDMLERNISYWDKQAITSGGGNSVSFIDEQGKEKKATAPTGVSKMIAVTRASEAKISANPQVELLELGEIAEKRVQRKGFLKPIKRTPGTKEFYSITKEFTAENLKDPVKVKLLIQGLKSSQVYQQQQKQLHKSPGKTTK